MTAPHPPRTTDDLLVLHALRCGGHAAPARLAAATGLTESAVESELIDLGVDGLVTRASGPFAAWGLTEAGRAAHARRIAGELDSAGARGAVRAAYDRFLVLNPELLDLCTAWQLKPVGGAPAVNDHRDPDYDARVLAGFARLHERAEPVIADLAAALSRFGRYRTRLAAALDRARAGETAYVADDLASYHTVWAELHEDLLATLGLPR
ncbi:transcriptional regulator [Streptomonospora sp. S1-112]|uniref:Transcriptional regulator n=1 Tax=Streptomonospora mangrovi TaxID=2883123 RepID=A0A9X3SC23_9ACTN|nr:transcriptional regulator [Streptomonospora mangrovi]MDA0563158.1 transcriptional regulator [Streptomonospora mangrovi]